VREDDEVTAVSGSTRAERRRDPSRVLALTDGVFAIIITLLVLDIHVPELSAHEKLGTAISDVRPSFISFVIVFIVAAMQWTGHRDLFTLIRYTDRGLLCPQPGTVAQVKAVWAADGTDSTGLFAGATGQGSDTAYPAKNTAAPRGTLTLSP
jgi:hypothetical protein